MLRLFSNTRFIWLPVPLLLATMIVLWVADLRATYASPLLLLLLNFLFTTLASLVVAVLVGKSFIRSGAPGLLLLGCGVLCWGGAAAFGTAASGHGINATVTVHNTLAWLAALCHFGGVVLSLKRYRRIRVPELTLAFTYSGMLCVSWLVDVLTMEDLMPIFFVQSHGGTLIRQFVLDSAIAMFGFSAAILWWTNRPSPSVFLRWYGVSLLLMATGLLGSMNQPAFGTPLFWTEQASQYLGGVYMLAAAIASMYESGMEGLSLSASLREAQQNYRALVELSPDAIAVYSDAEYVFVNPAAVHLFGATGPEDLIGRKVINLVHPEDRQAVAARMRMSLEEGRTGLVRQFRVLRMDGQSVEVESASVRIEFQGRMAVQLILRDITEIKRTEAALQESELRFRTMANAMPQMAWIAWADGYIFWYNQRWYDYTGTIPEQMVGWGWQSVHEPNELPKVLERWQNSISTGEFFDMTFPLRGADGIFRPFLTRVIPLKDAAGRVLQWFGTNTDVSELKRVEQSLRESQERLAMFASATFEGIIEIEAGHVVDCNDQFARMMGYPLDEIRGMEIANLIATEDLNQITANIQQIQKPATEYGLIRKDGTRIIVEAHGRLVSPGRCITAVRDITEQKRREDKLQQLNRTLNALNHSNAARMRATEETAYLLEVCQNIVKDCGHAMAWIGYAENNASQSVRPVASAGIEAGYLEMLKITYADTERGRGPTGTAIRSGRTSICRNMLTDPLFSPWRDEALKRGYASSISLPLMTNGRISGTINIYSRLPDPFSEDEVILLTELADDLSYGITSLRLRDERDRAENALKTAHEELEQRVLERTADLRSANEKLTREMEERRRVETALRKSDEQLSDSIATLTKVIDGITDPLIMLDKDLRIKKLNRAARDYYGLTNYQETIGKLCFEAFRGRSSPCEGCENPLSGLRGYFGSYERKGTVDPDRIEQVFVYLVKDTSGAPEATIVRIADITQVRMMDRRLIQSEKLASLGLLVSGIAHEINNPNNFISFNIPILRSYLQFLLPIVDDYALAHPELLVFSRPYPDFREDCFKLLDNMEHGSTRISQIVGNLREFARERGTGDRQWIDLKQVVEKGITICLGRIRKSIKRFEADIPEGLPDLFIDPLAIEQVVVNLLINAAQAADKVDSWVRLTIFRLNGAEDEVIIEVSDNGCGMDAETKRKIFDPFFTTKAVGVGTGLGLSISHRLVEELGGSIEVRSEVGKGSIFRVKLRTKTS